MAHSLLCLLGSTQTRENIGVPHWGSYNPYKGRVLEWRLRMYATYHHLAWKFNCPYPLCNKIRWRNSHFTLCKRGVSNSLSEGQINHQTKGHWQVHYVTSGTPPCSARSHKPGKRIKSSRSTSNGSHSHETQPKSSSRIRPALNYPFGKKKEVQLFVEQIFGTKA